MADYVPTATIYEGEGVTNFARVTHGSTGVDMLLAEVASVTLNVFDVSAANTTPGTAVDGPTALTVDTSLIFDTLQTSADNAAYTRDDDGYNFEHTYDGTTVFDEGGKLYLLEYKIVFTSFPDKFVLFRVKTHSTRSG